MIGIGVATGGGPGSSWRPSPRPRSAPELAALVEQLSGGILIVMLVLIGLFSLIPRHGLPTTANYIVVSSLMASVVVSLGRAGGADRAADRGASVRVLFRHHGRCDAACGPRQLWPAAAVSGGDPIKTGLHAFFYSLRTVALPFLFIFNPGADPLWGRSGHLAGALLQAGSVFVTATIAMLLFAAATQGYFLAPLAHP